MNPWFLVALIAGLLGLVKLTQDKSESHATDAEKKAAAAVKAKAKKAADKKAADKAEADRIEQQQKDDDAVLVEQVQAEENAELLDAARTIVDKDKAASEEHASD